MAIYTYTTGKTAVTISTYADAIISTFADVVISELSGFLPPVGNTFFNLNSATTVVSSSYSYNELSDNYFINLDYGSITDTIFESESQDFGSITSSIDSYDDYGLITEINTTAFGKVGNIVSTTEYSLTRVSEIQGVVFLFNGRSGVYITSPYIGYGSCEISGGISSEKNTESYVGSGSLFGFIDKAERVVASYNNSSVVSYVSEDYGFISSSIVSSEEYGSILDEANLYTERDDYGLIIGRGLRPYGLIRFSSAAIEKNTEDYIGSGKLFDFGTAKVFVKPTHIGKGILKIKGSYSDLKNTESYVGSGSLFGFGSKAERIVVSYNESSVVDYEGLDYGFISSSEDTIDDYGSILDEANLYTERDDYGLIVGRGLRPFGLTRFSSAAIEKNTEDYVGSGSLFNFGTVKVFVKPTHIGRGSIKIKGAYSDLKNTESYVGTGRAFGFGSKAESITASYNESSVVDYEGLDYGFISSSEDTIDDYGSITDIQLSGQQTVDYGLITGSGIRPFGLTRFSSAAIEKNTEDYVGSGKLFNFGNVTISTKPSYVGSGSFKITGSYSNLKNTESYVGTGRAFGFGSKAESTTASYNESSIVDYEGLDYGFISSSEDTIDDYGSITDTELSGQQTVDYGLITGRGLRPFGLTRFSGATLEKNTEDYVGSGSLFVFVSKTETNSYTPSISIELFRFSSATLEKNTESYVGTGRAFGFGSKAESTTASYNESSIVDYEGLDYGSITSSIDTFDDYGSITDTELSGQQTVDYGLITGRGLRPYGLTSFSGSVYTIITQVYYGSGSLFGFSSTTEAFGPKPPLSGLFRISGAATQSITPTTEIGSGSLFTFVSKVESFGANPPENIQLFRFSGTRVEKNTESYVGTGSLFGFSSTTESFGPKPPVSGLFRISGAATQSITPTTEIGSGSVLVRQASIILDADDKTRLVAAFERTGFREVAEPEAIRLRGRVGIYFQFRETGSGLLRVNGKSIIRLKPLHIGEGRFTINGSATESTTPATEIGSGSLFTFVSKVESFGANPPENTALFKFRGASVNKNTESYVGVGLERINVESLILIRPRYPGSGSVSITSISTDSRSYRHIAAGSLFGFGSAAEYFTNAYKLDTFVIKVRGSAKESNTEKFVGSGSVFAFISSAESKGANPPENTALFKFGGSGSGRTQPVYYGEGRFKVSEGSGRPDKNNKTFIISSDESKSTRSIEDAVQITISGSASSARPAVYKGKGSLFGFSSTTESATFSPDDTRELFKISGNAVEKNTESYVGSGSVFAFVGTSYSITKQTRGETNLFTLNGSARESFGEGLYTGNGKIITDLLSATTVSFTPKITTTLFKFTGSSTERNTEAFRGSGSIGVFTSTAKSVFYDYKVSQKAFRIFGNTFESFARSNYNGFTNTNIEGFSEDRKINYVPPKRVRVFII